jgi:hypothetical protein
VMRNATAASAIPVAIGHISATCAGLSLADLNGDWKLDVFFSLKGSHTVGVLLSTSM